MVIDKDKLGYGWFAVPIRLSNPSKFEVDEERSTCVVTILNRMEEIPHSLWAVESYSGYHGTEVPKNMIEIILIPDGTLNGLPQAGTTTLPQTIIFKLSAAYKISEFEILRRNDQYNTDLKGGYFEISMDNINWTRAATFDFGTGKSTGYVSFYCPTAVIGKYIKMVVTESNRNTQVSVQELKAHGELSK